MVPHAFPTKLVGTTRISIPTTRYSTPVLSPAFLPLPQRESNHQNSPPVVRAEEGEEEIKLAERADAIAAMSKARGGGRGKVAGMPIQLEVLVMGCQVNLQDSLCISV